MKVTNKQLGKSFANLLHKAKDETHKKQIISAFAEMLVNEGKVSKLNSFKQSFEKYWDEISGEVEVIMETADEHTPHFPKEILGKKVSLKTKKNPELIGGNIIQAGDIYIDNSLRTKIRKIANIAQN